jgi:hypothetical protein
MIPPAPPTPKDNPDKARTIRYTAAGTQIASGFISSQDPNEQISGTQWYGMMGRPGIAAQMWTDPHVRQSVAYISDPLCAATWIFKPASDSSLDIEIADFCTWAFFEQLDWETILQRIVISYCRDGFSLSEPMDDMLPIPVDRFPSHPGAGIGLVPTDFAEIPANTAYRFFQQQDKPSLLGQLQQYRPYSDVEGSGFNDVPSSHILRLTWQQEGANFVGVPPLRSAYGPWKLKIAFQTIEAIAHERSSVPIPMANMPDNPGDEDVKAAMDILAEMRANPKSYALWPFGYKFEWATSGRDTTQNLAIAIERCNKDIAINVSAGFMLLGLTGKTGSFALGSTQQSQYHLGVVKHAKFISNRLTLGSDGWSPVERIVRMNYGPGVPIPRAIVKNLPTKNWNDVVPMLINATNTNPPLITVDDALEDEVRDVLQFGPRDPETARKRTESHNPDFGQPSDKPAIDTESADDISSEPMDEPAHEEAQRNAP